LRRLAASVLAFGTQGAFAHDAQTCKALDAAANEQGTRIPGDTAVYTVTGHGRLPFYSAPDRGCGIAGVLIVPGDDVIAYVDYRGYTAVLYVNDKTGAEPTGWVESSRLRASGRGIAPKQ
jgi:hypothetical protein